MAMTRAGDIRLVRTIGWQTAAAVVIANMVGSGIFTTSGFIARDTGSPSLLLVLWIAGGAIALTGALAYAELGAAMPEAGGEYVYLREAYGPLAGYLSGWTSFFAGFSGALAAALLAFTGYAAAFVPALGGLDAQVVAIATLWILTSIQLGGAWFGGKLQNLLTVVTLILIVALISAGFASPHGAITNFHTSARAQGSVFVSLIFVLYAYSGWNAAAYLGGEIRDPARNIPRALLTGTASVIALYVALNALYLWALPVTEMSGVLPIAQKAATVLFGPRASTAVSAIIAVAMLSSASAMVMAGPRIYFAMACDGVIPRRVASTRRSSTPAVAIILQATWTTFLITVFGVFERIVVYTGFAITIFSAATVAAVLVMRWREPERVRPFRMPAARSLVIIYVGVSALIAGYTIADRPVEALLGLLTVAGGLPIYWLTALVRKTPHGLHEPIAVQIKSLNR